MRLRGLDFVMLTLADREREALAQCARIWGVYRWKSHLRTAWENGKYSVALDSATLQYLRNASYFGPAGLEKFRLPE